MKEIFDKFNDVDFSIELLEKVKIVADHFYSKHGRKPVLMEVCGSHTQAFAKSGVKYAIKDHIHLIAGPGCPVCVTDQSSIDSMIELANKENVILCTFGDMVRVPGSRQTLMQSKSQGKDVRIVYSPLDAVKIAKENPTKEVVFLGIGFETTIPLLGASVKEAERHGVKNYSVWMNTKLVEPILRYLISLGEVKVDGFLLPGHVSIVTGEEFYYFLRDEYKVPGIISGFEPVELLSGLYRIIECLLSEKAEIINDYPFVVTKKGNKVAQDLMTEFFEVADEPWRGMGIIPKSGMDFKATFNSYNAKKKFDIEIPEARKTKCKCGEIIRGLIEPPDCALFGKACKPVNPIGPCMVSSEGSCAAYYNFMREE
ncbi:MAG: hypD [Bacillales bacterium]|jgi:hydrogenase expression/formation protein HypD|nr:hypD [Bacillales bacterium]